MNEILEKIDLYLFRILGLFLGFFGCAALLVNNPLRKLFTNPYGVVFFLMFFALGVYSLVSIARETMFSREEPGERR